MALLKYLNDYFGVKYPLPKLDLVALPEDAANAMEHWGVITIFEGSLLYDPAKSQADTRRDIFLLLAHEIAHQWFGNLVTMAWWNDLWLNEGFATWMEYKAVERLQPDLQPWLSANGDKQLAMERDLRSNARVMRRPIANEGEAEDKFGTKTYSKGQALVRMIESFVGEDVFRDAMQRYMKERAYSNATVDDLTHALDAAAGKSVGPVLLAYTEQPGGIPRRRLRRSASRCCILSGARLIVRLMRDSTGSAARARLWRSVRVTIPRWRARLIRRSPARRSLSR